MIRCSDIMSKNVHCCEAYATVQDVAKVMRSRNVGTVPIVADLDSKELLGIVTHRDLVFRILADGLDPTTTLVRDVMTRRLVTCEPDDSIHMALEMMERNHIRRVLIVDHVGRFVGIISLSDIVNRFKQPNRSLELFEALYRLRVPTC